MLTKNEFPILEFDDAPEAKLNPANFVTEKFQTDKLVITFFPEVMDRLAEEYHVTPNAVAVAWIMRHPARIQTIVGSTNAQRVRGCLQGLRYLPDQGPMV